MHFIHTTGNESTPIASGNIVASDSPESLSKHTNDGNNNSSNSGITVTVTPVQRPSKLRGKTVLLKHLEIDERFFYKSPPSALNIEGEGSRNENTKKILSSPKSDGDLNARRLSSMENEKENGRSPFIRNFERRTISDENRSIVRVFEGDILDLKAGAKNSSIAVTRNHNTEQFMNESSSYSMDSIGSTLRGKLSLSPTASELHEKKEVDNRGGGGGGSGGVINTTSMSRLKCDINSNGYGYGTADGNVFKRTNSDTLNFPNSEVKDSRITDYSIERKNSKDKEYKSSYDNFSVKKIIMKPSPPLSQPPKSKQYVINKREHSPPIIDISSPSPSHSSIESKTNFFFFLTVKPSSTFLSSSFSLLFFTHLLFTHFLHALYSTLII